MKGSRVAVVVVLLSLAPLAGVAAVEPSADLQRMQVVSGTDTAEYLAPAHQDVNRSGQPTATIDVGGAVGSGVGEARVAHLRSSLERRYAAADTDEERAEVVRNGTVRLSERAENLSDEHDRTVAAYGDGEMEDAEFVRRIALLHRQADALLEAVEWLEVVAADHDLDPEVDRLQTDRVALYELHGPVGADLAAAAEGEGDVRVHVDSSGQGLVLATMVQTDRGPEYVRQTTDPTAWTHVIEDRYDRDPGLAFDRIEELYPWVVEHAGSFSASAPIGPAATRVYPVELSHAHGDLEVYLDGGSGDVYREVQVTDPELVPTGTQEATSGNLQLVANTTHAGGPLGVTVVDMDTGEPVDAAVDVNGDHVGSTEGERLWTVAPRGDATVNATYQGETVRLDLHFR